MRDSENYSLFIKRMVLLANRYNLVTNTIWYQMVKQIRKGTNAKEGKEAKVQKKKQIKKHDKKHNQYKSRGVK